MPLTPDTRQPLPLRRVAALVAFLLFGPPIAFHIWDRIEAARFWGRVEAIERRGESLKYQPERPATEEQRRASRLYAEAMRGTIPANTKVFQQAGRTIEELAALPAAEAAQDARFDELRQIEVQHSPVLELIDRAAALDAHGIADADMEGRFPTDRLPASVNAIRIAHLALHGDGDAAASALLSTLRMRRALPFRSRFFAFVYSDWTAHSLQLLLTRTRPSAPRLERLQQEYARITDAYRVEQLMIAERARFLSFAIPGEFGGSEYVRAIGPAEALAGLLLRPLWTNRLVAQLDDYAEAIEAAREAWPRKLDTIRALQQERRGAAQAAEGRRRPFLVRMLGVWTRNTGSSTAAAAASAAADGIARAGVAVAALAVTRYHDAHGSLPATLAEAHAAFGPAPPPDPFTGGELRYIRDGQGFKVYSVGVNRADDGGRFAVGSDLLPPRRDGGDDIGIAVMPIKRRPDL